jgi:hypothetical protein
MQLYIKQMEYKLQFISSLSLNEWKEFHKSRQSYSRRLEIPFIFSFLFLSSVVLVSLTILSQLLRLGYNIFWKDDYLECTWKNAWFHGTNPTFPRQTEETDREHHLEQPHLNGESNPVPTKYSNFGQNIFPDLS